MAVDPRELRRIGEAVIGLTLGTTRLAAQARFRD
jgi:hypothetical protein